MPYYKIVNENLESHVMDCYNIGLQVQYKLNEFVYADAELLAKGYGLFVYEQPHPPLHSLVFEVEIDTIIPLPVKLNYNEITKDIILNSLTLEPYSMSQASFRNVEFSTETRCVKGVKLLKRLFSF